MTQNKIEYFTDINGHWYIYDSNLDACYYLLVDDEEDQWYAEDAWYAWDGAYEAEDYDDPEFWCATYYGWSPDQIYEELWGKGRRGKGKGRRRQFGRGRRRGRGRGRGRRSYYEEDDDDSETVYQCCAEAMQKVAKIN